MNVVAPRALTVFTLPQGARALEVADACRVALLAFLRGSPTWGKHQLARWLSGPYSALVSLAPACEAVSPPSSRRRGRVDERALQDVMHEARETLLGAMRMASHTKVTPASDLLRNGALRRCEDEEGNKGWVPVNVPGMRLADRVRALWAIDYAARSEDYRSVFLVCPACRWPVFDAVARQRGVCCSPVASDIFMISPREVMRKRSG